MMNTVRKIVKVAAIATAAFMVCLAPAMTSVYAENSIPTGTVGTVDPSKDGTGSTVAGTDGMPSSSNIFEDVKNSTATIEEIGDKLTGKGIEVVDLLRKLGLVVSVGAFIVGVFVMISGAISKKGTVMPGLITCLVAVIAFGLTWYAPQIVMWGKDLLK